uniref:Uncharacterized protein n=1 Tax=Rhizophora mucronata TaxID=61149 RepID=A0A2P2Q981_RHIMU
MLHFTFSLDICFSDVCLSGEIFFPQIKASLEHLHIGMIEIIMPSWNKCHMWNCFPSLHF